MAGWKALKKEDRDWVKDILREAIGDQQEGAKQHPTDAAQYNHGIGVLAIAIDVLDKACPPQERSG